MWVVYRIGRGAASVPSSSLRGRVRVDACTSAHTVCWVCADACTRRPGSESTSLCTRCASLLSGVLAARAADVADVDAPTWLCTYHATSRELGACLAWVAQVCPNSAPTVPTHCTNRSAYPPSWRSWRDTQGCLVTAQHSTPRRITTSWKPFWTYFWTYHTRNSLALMLAAVPSAGSSIWRDCRVLCGTACGRPAT